MGVEKDQPHPEQMNNFNQSTNILFRKYFIIETIQQ